MVDTHTHLSLCEPAASALVDAATHAGVHRMLTVGIGDDSNPVAIGHAAEFGSVFAAVGRHPNSVEGFTDADAEALESLCASDGVVAVGETGLDWFRRGSPAEDQRRAFSAQIAIATRAKLPVVVHLRDQQGVDSVYEEAFGTLAREAREIGVILHCFSADASWAEKAADRGWYCSFAGNSTYPKAPELREAAAVVPDDRILVETDAPFLSPQPMRGKPNEPANVVATAERIAEVRGVSYTDFEAQVEANAARVFGW